MTPRTIGEFRGGGRATASGGPTRPARRWDLTRTLRAAAAVAGLTVIGAYLGIALARIGYPGHLEILEGNSLVEVHRILAGQQLYAAPSASYVPDGYPPLYFAVSAAAASVLGQSYLPLRLVSLIASLVCFVILGRLVQRETQSRTAGAAAAGLLAATYSATGTWFDVGRVDSLFLALSVAGLYAARWACRTRGAIAAGLLLGAAFLTKQSALAEGVVVLAAMAAGPRRRLAVPAAVTYAAVVGGSTLVLGLTSHGWYIYYIFEQVSQHKLSPGSAHQWWAADLLPTLGIAICAALLGARRVPLVLLAGCGALTVESFAARAQTGSNLNDLLPAYLAVAVLAGLAMGGLPRWRRGPGGRWIPVAVSGLVLVQIGVLAGGFRLSQAFPPNADRLANQRLVAATRALGGTVAIPADPGIAVTAGLPPAEDQIAAADVLHAKDQGPKNIFMTSLSRALATQQFSGIITEFNGDLRGFRMDLLRRYYHRCPQAPLDGVLSVPFSANASALPVTVWLPIGHGPSCAAVVRTLESQES
ncbi:MAG: glycosyltransferase family 39 protein [Streptosporangiaceae bacterium]